MEKGKRALIQELLEDRFGPTTEAVRQRVAEIPASALKDFARRIDLAEFLEALGLVDRP